jgi:hypothetical protein
MRATFLVPLLTLVASLGPRAALGADRCARSGPYSLQVVDEAGRELPTFSHRGRTYVLGAPGGRYLLRIHNGSGRRIEVVASVDGRDVVDGTPSALAKRGYLVDAWGTVTIDGFRLSDASVAAFRFGAVEDSYAARMGDARDVGVIGVGVFAEARPPVPVPVPRRPEEDRAQRSTAEPQAAPAPSSGAGARGDGLARKSEAEGRERPGLGTRFGEEHESHVVEVAFERASERPDAVLTARYDDRPGLLALGIDVDGIRVSSRDRWLREAADPFRRDGTYSAPPPGWSPR